MARLRPRGIYWELAWSGPDLDPATGKKKRHTQNLGRRDVVGRRDAELALKHLQRELFLDDHALRAPASPPFSRWAEEYLAWHAAQYPASHFRTAQVVEQHLLPGWEFKRLDEVTDDDLEEKMTAWRAAGYRDHTITKHLRVAKALFSRAVEKKVLHESPADTVQPPQILDAAPHIFYDVDELDALYLASSFDQHHPEDSQHAPWHMPAWKLFANTGMRRGEGLALKRRWVGTDGMKIVSTGEERTKSGAWRDIPIFPGAREALEGLPVDGEYVLPRVSPSWLSKAAAKCMARAELVGSLHTLRHTFISHLAMDPNVPVRTIQLWAGHASITTTEKYMYLRRGAVPIALAL